MNTFDTFVMAEHQKRVNHLVRYLRATGSERTKQEQLGDTMEIFGYCQKDAQPILDDALAAL